MHRIYEYLRRHPVMVDGAWSMVLLLSPTLWILLTSPPVVGSRVFGVASMVLAWVVITLRRRFPEEMLILAIALSLAQVVVGESPGPSSLAVPVIIFTVAARNVVWASRLALTVALLGPGVAQLRWADQQGGYAISTTAVNILLLTACCVLAWVTGDSLRTRRAYYAELEERAARLERERETQSRIAVAAERARIARELHDVVAHNVSVMVVQADGAAYVLDSAPEQSRSALRNISATGRQALTEMRRLLGVLREEDGSPADDREGTGDSGSGAYLPQPGLDQLDELIAQVRTTGMRVNFLREGDQRPLPSGVELTAYRIVQEALTNTRKHGGEHAEATIRLSFGDRELAVHAEDNGQGPVGQDQQGGTDGLGHGLIGMRERVSMVGGELRTGPRPGGGYRITATLPVNGTKNAASRQPMGPAPAGPAPAGPAPASPAPTGSGGSADGTGPRSAPSGSESGTPAPAGRARSAGD